MCRSSGKASFVDHFQFIPALRTLRRLGKERHDQKRCIEQVPTVQESVDYLSLSRVPGFAGAMGLLNVVMTDILPLSRLILKQSLHSFTCGLGVIPLESDGSSSVFFWRSRQALQGEQRLGSDGYRAMIKIRPTMRGCGVWEWSETYQSHRSEPRQQEGDIPTKEDRFCWIRGATRWDPSGFCRVEKISLSRVFEVLRCHHKKSRRETSSNIRHLNHLRCDSIKQIMKQERQTAIINGSRVSYVIAGEGSPAVVLLTGYGVNMDLSWKEIVPQLETISTVFAYDRLNYGKSDRSEEGVPQTGKEIVAFLHDLLLQQTQLHPPYLIVGHSIGGMYAQLYARLFPDEVSGVVLLDSSHPEQVAMKRACKESVFRLAVGKFFDWLAAVGNPRRHTEISSFEETAKQISSAPSFPDIPLVVVSAGKASLFTSEEFWSMHQNNQRRLVALSPQGRQIIAKNSGHFVQFDEPEVVLQAIKDMLSAVREK